RRFRRKEESVMKARSLLAGIAFGNGSIAAARRIFATVALAMIFGTGAHALTATLTTVNSTTAVSRTTTYVPPPPPPETIPKPPLSQMIALKTSATIPLAWIDASAVEAGYRIERQDGRGIWIGVGTVGPVSATAPAASYKVSGLASNTRYCL